MTAAITGKCPNRWYGRTMDRNAGPGGATRPRRRASHRRGSFSKLSASAVADRAAWRRDAPRELVVILRTAHPTDGRLALSRSRRSRAPISTLDRAGLRSSTSWAPVDLPGDGCGAEWENEHRLTAAEPFHVVELLRRRWSSVHSNPDSAPGRVAADTPGIDLTARETIRCSSGPSTLASGVPRSSRPKPRPSPASPTLMTRHAIDMARRGKQHRSVIPTPAHPIDDPTSDVKSSLLGRRRAPPPKPPPPKPHPPPPPPPKTPPPPPPQTPPPPPPPQPPPPPPPPAHPRPPPPPLPPPPPPPRPKNQLKLLAFIHRSSRFSTRSWLPSNSRYRYLFTSSSCSGAGLAARRDQQLPAAGIRSYSWVPTAFLLRTRSDRGRLTDINAARLRVPKRNLHVDACPCWRPGLDSRLESRRNSSPA